jgi:hypothetical protein
MKKNDIWNEASKIMTMREHLFHDLRTSGGGQTFAINTEKGFEVGDRLYSRPVGLNFLSPTPIGTTFHVDRRSFSHGRSRDP